MLISTSYKTKYSNLHVRHVSYYMVIMFCLYIISTFTSMGPACLLQIHLSFSLDRDPELDEESKAESEGNIIVRGILSILNHFASIIGNAKDAELKYVQ